MVTFFIKGPHMYISLLLNIFSVNFELHFVQESPSSHSSSCKIIVKWHIRKKMMEIYFGKYC